MVSVTTPKQLFSRENYSEKLRDPKWESFRKSYVRRRRACCSSCKRGGIMVQVHHLAYERGREPWEYADEELTLLCKDCHERWHKLINAFKLTTGRMPASNLQMLVGALSVIIKQHDATEFCFALCQLACEKHTIQRLKMSWERGDKSTAAPKQQESAT